ncbi:unnamed protein product [Medioppia subpectinata]|uniref:ABC-2 type transporter transmembrane domain-containing protein n=1 Tax=Medioppia subpectinata TaxID=1979941 RepID=A0A7R9L1D9_9ACAR|nr:unnamed protein product [Medioppia subpectinata]CAG2113474.1 unnamed protein product [Medioppia subpectinata]
MGLSLFCLFIAFMLSYLYGWDVGKEDGCLDLHLTNSSLSITTSLKDALKIVSEESDVIENVKLLFFMNGCLGFVSMACTLLVFPTEVRVFLNEHRNRWYSTSSYYWSKCFVEIPVTIVIAFTFATIMFYSTGQLSDSFRYSYFALNVIFVAFIANSVGNLIGILFADNYQLATTMGVALFMSIFLLGGFAVRLSSQDVFIRALSYGSFLRFNFYSVLVISQVFVCSVWFH